MAIRRAVSSLWASVTRAAPVASAFQLPFSAAGGVRSFAGSESAPAKPTLGAGVNGAAPSGPEPDSFISTGASKLTDTMYFRRLGAARSGKALSGAFTPNSFAGRVVLFVNTASLCGFTPQLRQMQVGARMAWCARANWPPLGLLCVDGQSPIKGGLACLCVMCCVRFAACSHYTSVTMMWA